MVYAVQGEKNSRKIRFDLFNGGVQWEIDRNASVLISYKKADGHGGIYDTLEDGSLAYAFDESSHNIVTITLAEQVLTTPGEVRMVVSFVSGDSVMSTFQILVHVDESPGLNSIESEDYFSLSVAIDAAIKVVGETIGDFAKYTKVIVTSNGDNTYSADHTLSEIQKAVEDGNIVYCQYNNQNLWLSKVRPFAEFGSVYGNISQHIRITTAGVALVETLELGGTGGGGNTVVLDAVLYTPQYLTPEEQAQARQNIGIDELPTGWETSYRLISKIVFDETNQTQHIKITQDMDGKPLELTKVLIYADLLAATSRADCNIKLNNIKFPWFFNMEQTAYKNILEAEMFEDLCYIHYYSKIAGTSKAEGGGVYAVNIPELKINEIVWSATGVNPPPNGSTFAVYGY